MTDEKYLKRDGSLWGRTRDKIAYHVATFALNRIATRWYAGMIEGSIRLGLVASQDTRCGYEWDGNEVPGNSPHVCVLEHRHEGRHVCCETEEIETND